MHVVLSLGGSLVNTENGIDIPYIEKIKSILEKTSFSFGIVVGGGFEARKKAKKLRSKGLNEFECDEAAIKITWKNAKAVAKSLNAPQSIPKDFKKARALAQKNRFVVMGGTIPGITTDADSVLLAEALKAVRVINISNTDGIYETNPKDNPHAKKYSQLSYEQLIELAIKSDTRTAGTNFVFDLLACKLIARSKLETHFVSGKNLEDVEHAIKGEKHGGTVVTDQ